jgi:hypothetical protein
MEEDVSCKGQEMCPDLVPPLFTCTTARPNIENNLRYRSKWNETDISLKYSVLAYYGKIQP